MADGGALDRAERRKSAHRSRGHGPPIFDQTRALLNQVITATISRDQTHLKRLIAIRRAPFDAFYNAYREIKSGASIQDRKAYL